MLRNIFLVSLLIYAVSAAHWEIREVDSAEDQDEEITADGMVKSSLSPECMICKMIVSVVKDLLSSKPRVDEIKTKLSKICDVLKERKVPCKNFVEKYMDKLVNKLMANDASNICAKILICQKHKEVKGE